MPLSAEASPSGRADDVFAEREVEFPGRVSRHPGTKLGFDKGERHANVVPAALSVQLCNAAERFESTESALCSLDSTSPQPFVLSFLAPLPLYYSILLPSPKLVQSIMLDSLSVGVTFQSLRIREFSFHAVNANLVWPGCQVFAAWLQARPHLLKDRKILEIGR